MNEIRDFMADAINLFTGGPAVYAGDLYVSNPALFLVVLLVLGLILLLLWGIPHVKNSIV